VIIYKFLYWTSMLYSYAAIPIVQGYTNSVDLTPAKRLKRSLLSNLKFYLLMAPVGVAFVGYLAYSGMAKEYGLIMFLKSMANAFGITLIILLLGYSLAAIPKAHMRTAQLHLQMKYLYFRTSTIL
jgi:hypothetical protein